MKASICFCLNVHACFAYANIHSNPLEMLEKSRQRTTSSKIDNTWTRLILSEALRSTSAIFFVFRRFMMLIKTSFREQLTTSSLKSVSNLLLLTSLLSVLSCLGCDSIFMTRAMSRKNPMMCILGSILQQLMALVMFCV